MDDEVEQASISVEVDGGPVQLPVRLRFRAPFEFWIAETTLPRSVTPHGVVSVLGIGADRPAALRDLIRTADDAIARHSGRTTEWPFQIL